MKYCNQCGAQLDDDMMFCGTCGAKQEVPAASASPAEITAEAAAATEAVVTETAQAAEAAVTETAAATEAAVTETAQAAEAAVTEAAAAAEAAVTETAAAAEAAVTEGEEAGFNPSSEITPDKPVAFTPYPIPSDTLYMPESVDPSTPAAPVNNPPKKSKKGLIIGIIAAAVVIVAALGAILTINALKKETIDASKLIKVLGYGPDGYGTVAYMIADEHEMHDVFWPKDDAEEPFPDLWSFLYEQTSDEEQYPDGVLSWIEQNESEYFRGTKAFKSLKNEDKIDEAKEELTKLKVTVEDDGKNGNYKVGDTVTVIVKGDEDDLKKAHVKLTNTKFEYTFTEDDFVPVKKIDPFAGFTVTFEGYEGNPEIKYNFDAIDPEVRNLMYHSVNYEELSAAKNNGDKITFTATPYGDINVGYLIRDGKYYTCSKDDLVKVVTVSGLKELEELNLFEGLSFDYEGCAPSLGLSVNTSGMPQVIQDNISLIDYRLSKSTGLDIGETITITAKIYSSAQRALAEAGYKYDETKLTMEYTIPENVPRILDGSRSGYAYEPEELFGMKAMAEACVGQPFLPGNVPVNGTIGKIGEVRYSQRKLLVNQTSDGKVTNALWQLCEIDYTVVSDAGETAKTIYLVCKADNAFVNENNKVAISTAFNGIYFESMEEVNAEFSNGEANAATVIDF